MPDNDDNTISTTIKETSQSKDNKEEPKEEQESALEDLLQEMGAAAVSSIGEVLYKKYSSERLDGKPRDKS